MKLYRKAVDEDVRLHKAARNLRRTFGLLDTAMSKFSKALNDSRLNERSTKYGLEAIRDGVTQCLLRLPRNDQCYSNTDYVYI